MASWNHSYGNYAISQDDQKLDDYYECLIECETDQTSCKRICKEILNNLRNIKCRKDKKDSSESFFIGRLNINGTRIV